MRDGKCFFQSERYVVIISTMFLFFATDTSSFTLENVSYQSDLPRIIVHTVFSIHEFSNGIEIITEVVLSDIYEKGKNARNNAYNDFKTLLTSEISDYSTFGDDPVPLVYIMIKDHKIQFKTSSFEKDISEVHNKRGQIIIWTEPSSYGQILFIINAYDPDPDLGKGGFKPDNTFLCPKIQDRKKVKYACEYLHHEEMFLYLGGMGLSRKHI